jgi:hypothetical protein
MRTQGKLIARWNCIGCRKVGTMQWTPGMASDELLSRIRRHHADRTPNCEHTAMVIDAARGGECDLSISFKTPAQIVVPVFAEHDPICSGFGLLHVTTESRIVSLLLFNGEARFVVSISTSESKELAARLMSAALQIESSLQSRTQDVAAAGAPG